MKNTEKALETAPKSSESQLIELLRTADIDLVLTNEALTIKSLVTQISSGLDFQSAHSDAKIFNLKAKMGKGLVIRLLCAIIKSFCDSIKATRTMDAIDTVECAELLEEKYSHDSPKDIILALKKAKLKGMTFYNTIDTSVIMSICEEYFESKSKWLEGRHKEIKSQHGDIRDEALTIQKSMDESLKRQKAIADSIKREKDELRRIELERQKVEILKQQNQ